MQFLCDYANAVIDDETGEIMEYRHLLKNPKHRERWQRSFSKEIWRLATATKTIKFVTKSDGVISPTRASYVTNDPRRRIQIEQGLLWEAIGSTIQAIAVHQQQTY